MGDTLYLIPGMSQRHEELWKWKNEESRLHEFIPDFHRLQLENWIWKRRSALGHRVMDIAAENPRRWIGEGYFTVGLNGCDTEGDLLALPLDDNSIDGAIVTEVLEHCADPPLACREIRRVLKPGGLAMFTSPFIWPWHGTAEYPDFWRFTAQGWQLLLRDFAEVKIEAAVWTDEGRQFYSMLRRFEAMGIDGYTQATTGYFCEATK